MRHDRIRQIIELLMEIVWIVINKKRNKPNENNDKDGLRGDL